MSVSYFSGACPIVQCYSSTASVYSSFARHSWIFLAAIYTAFVDKFFEIEV